MLKRIIDNKCKIAIFLFAFILIFAKDTPYRNSRRLIHEIRAEDVKAVQELLDSGVNPNTLSLSPIADMLAGFVESGPERPLSVACKTGNLKMVELLIAYGATAEPCYEAGWSPLFETIFYYQPEDVEIVKLLLENGTDTIDDTDYELPVFIAAEMFPEEYDSERANGTYYKGGYREDIAKGITEIVKILLDERSINIQHDGHKKTLLILATERENIYLAEYLVSEGCDIQIKDKYGKTAYDYAVENGNQTLIDLLK